MISSWSHSRAVDFEKCKRLAFLKYVKRIPELPRPLPPGKTEHANDRGSRVHDHAEHYVRGTHPDISPEMKAFRTEFEAMRRLFAAGTVSLEGEWGFNQDWEAADWKTAWLRMKLDALVFLSPYEAVAIDYKTGKKFGNEIKHGEQVMLYQLACFQRYPELEEVHTELWYLDHDDLTRRSFTRAQGLRFHQSWDRRGRAITNCAEFPANPNKWSCQYCPYGAPENGFPNGTGDCLVGRKP
jgi:CRISPR/Cas system-associated exonuclease Cas4 (RecB family)